MKLQAPSARLHGGKQPALLANHIASALCSFQNLELLNVPALQ